MSATPKGAPALTPEEWVKWSAPTRFRSLDRTIDDPNELYCRISKEGLLVIPDAHFEWAVNGRARHALAALALHGQEFGFRREDVEDCRDAGDAATCGKAYPDDLWARMNRLADRIEALLPPQP